MPLKRITAMSGLALFACVTSTLLGQDGYDAEVQESRHFPSGVVLRSAGQTHVVESLAIESSDEHSELTLSGFLESEAEGDYHFAAKFVGQLRVSLRGKVLLEHVSDEPTWISSASMPLAYDWHELRISLTPTANTTRVSLRAYWSGPGFRWEPIPAARLGHARTENRDNHLDRGQALVRVLRCQACHELGRAKSRALLRAPNLTNAFGNLREPWLRQFLSIDGEGMRSGALEMAWARFHGRFVETEADDIIAFLSSLATPPAAVDSALGEAQKGEAQKGRELFFSLGCLACHKYGSLGQDNLFSGGDLTGISAKRPAGFVRRWLTDPARVDADHRMPKFQLSDKELNDLSAFLADASETAKSETAVAETAKSETAVASAAAVKRGRQLAVQHRCASCHGIDSLSAPSELKSISHVAKWARSCLHGDGARQPNYGFRDEADSDAVERFVKQAPYSDTLSQDRQLIEENNCLRCHARDASPGLLPVIQQVVERHGSLVSQLPRMVAPSLNSVGDKLHERALRASIARQAQANRHRAWLSVRMPTFPLTDSQVDRIADCFMALDRVPDEAISEPTDLPPADLAGADRLVTSDGFGCTSCHEVGKVMPLESTPLNQLGPGLTGLGKRIRKSWFDRWVRNPARMVPKMEMPSVQVAVPSLLNGNLDQQLTAVWQLLNTKGFNPPDPNPTRIAFRTGTAGEPAIVLTDVLRFSDKQLTKPFLIGLPNRHNVLIDLAEGRFAGWWTGDTATQRTQGKSWFWSAPLFGVQAAPERAELLLLRQGQPIEPQLVGQFVTAADAWVRINRGVELEHRLHFPTQASTEPCIIRITQRFVAVDGGWTRRIRARGLAEGDTVALRPSGLESSLSPTDQNGLIPFAADEDARDAVLELEYRSAEKVSPFFEYAQDATASATRSLDVMPGFRVTRLPLRSDVMPTALAWKSSGELIIASLKGRVWEAKDTDGDELEDALRVISDDLAAPYGLHAGEGFVDVLNKYGLVRLHDDDGDGQTDRHEVVASGWGHTADYHDWAVGLPRDALGNYYVAIPCQQDERSEAAAYLRGTLLRLVPRRPTDRDPRRFQLEIMTGGHRFPMGIALNQRGDVFVTDNQGNYNPFNELNHIVKGARYGFINKQEQSPGFAPKLTPPAIEIPHPWTRSVNGVCFLETPPELRRSLYGPFEGQLVGCEYDTRRLIRLSIEQIDGWFQGAAYPLAEAAPDPADGLQGPINCAVAPDGDLYIANIRDSGWGGANNTGSIVRIVPELQNLPTGIKVVKASPTGFHVEFTHPVDRVLAADPERYAISSYRRISTPAYGGDDVDRRTERITNIIVAADATSVELELENPRTGFVYEFRLRSLIEDPRTQFFPAEAFYTLGRRPKAS